MPSTWEPQLDSTQFVHAVLEPSDEAKHELAAPPLLLLEHAKAAAARTASAPETTIFFIIACPPPEKRDQRPIGRAITAEQSAGTSFWARARGAAAVARPFGSAPAPAMQASSRLPSPALPSAPVAALRDDGSLDAAHASALTNELAVALYEHMVLSRTLDDRLVALQREGAITQHASSRGE